MLPLTVAAQPALEAENVVFRNKRIVSVFSSATTQSDTDAKPSLTNHRDDGLLIDCILCCFGRCENGDLDSMKESSPHSMLQVVIDKVIAMNPELHVINQSYGGNNKKLESVLRPFYNCSFYLWVNYSGSVCFIESCVQKARRPPAF